jgi:hypothetical protein
MADEKRLAEIADKDLQDARRAVAAIPLPLPTDFRSAVEGVRLLANLLELAVCFPDGEALLRRLCIQAHPENWDGLAHELTVPDNADHTLSLISSLSRRAGEAETKGSCPCEWTTPCDPQCACVKRYSSRGCAWCCRYGNDEQRRARAEHLVALLRRTE